MKTKLKENNLYEKEVRQDLSNIIKPNPVRRPNIDHLIRRIIIERNKKQKKDIITSTLFLIILAGFIMFYLYN